VQRALIAGDAAALDHLIHDHPELFRDAPNYGEPDAISIIARFHKFDSWDDCERFFAARNLPDSPIARFETATDAIVSGDIDTLHRLLHDDPELIRARSQRRHHATLLHYTAANGVEDFRQKTPANIVPIAAMLLDAGAEVDAEADVYGGGAKTLGLAVTSIHPLLAGVIEPLADLLVARGAAVEDSVINDCLANGRQLGAKLMARHGARIDLEGAAGLGRLDLVQQLFDSASETKKIRGFAWACEYGRTETAAYFLDHEFDISARLPHQGCTGLHWAAYTAHTETVKLLLDRHAPVDIRDEKFDGTPLAWAEHALKETIDPAKHEQFDRIIKMLKGDS
jgi:hypothetical protein